MKGMVCLICFAVGVLSSPVDDWLSFKQTHKKQYSSPEEDLHRKSIFLKSKQLIDDHNKKFVQGLTSFHLKMNRFGDLTNEEYRALMNNKLNHSSFPSNGLTFKTDDSVDIPKSVDWREKGAVSYVKDQGECGACWAFSSTGALEGQHFRKTGKLVALSEQNLIDCSRKYSNQGCFGGLMNSAFTYVRDNGGIDTEDAYPYEAKDGQCRFKRQSVGANNRGHVELPAGDEEALRRAVATVGPISVAIDSGEDTFRFYSGGLYYDKNCCPENLIHAVLVVGYGSEQGKDFWLVKNSWNANWGENGYIRIARNRNNHCGIASKPSYPLV